MMYRKARIYIWDLDSDRETSHIVCVESLEAGLELGWKIESVLKRFKREECVSTVAWLEDDDGHYYPLLIDRGLNA
jgi:hypothetical protein